MSPRAEADTDDCPVKMLDGQNEERGMHSAGSCREVASGYELPPNRDMRRFGNYGGASRFFKVYTYIGHQIEHPPGCGCAECALDDEWLKTDPSKGRPEAYTRTKLRGLRGLVLGRVYLDAKRFWVRTCFWGADDTGIERDRQFSSLEEAAAYYEHESRWLSGLVLVDREVLLGMGFVWA